MKEANTYKLGSLFDGSGGFPLAGSLCGITPVWAAEVEPYPIAVTRSCFPNMKHLGSVTNIKGNEIEPVDIITFGSPCQDLSVAGKRAGLKHEDNGDDETTRSGLFMEAVRIIKEMRKATNGVYPRFAVWENVPGAFSSNKGEDFRIVCETLVKIVEPAAVMPAVPKAGWSYADSYCGDGWSLAYRVFDAQYWGVPKRRRRIYLVADFGGERAREILFERDGLRGYFAESGTPGQGVTADAERSVGADDCEGAVPYTLKIRSGCEGGCKGALIQTDKSATLATNNDQYLFQPVGLDIYNLAETGSIAASLTTATGQGASNTGPSVCVPVALGTDSRNYIVFAQNQREEVRDLKDRTVALNAQPGTHQQTFVCVPIVDQHILDDQGGSVINVRTDGKSPTLRAQMGGHPPVVMVPAVVYDARGNGDGKTVNTLTGDHNNRITDYSSVVVKPKAYGISSYDSNAMKSANPHSGIYEADTSRTLDANGGNPCCNQGGIAIVRAFFNQGQNAQYDRHGVAYCTDVGFFNSHEEVSPTLLARQYKDPHLVTYPQEVQYIVRRLTPTECARLQGFADRWGDIDTKSEFSDEEYRFWLDARNTHAAINGKAVKEYTKAQMLTWYNKLHTDSSEYKMWGNGIALPTALYCMQGIEDVLKGANADD